MWFGAKPITSEGRLVIQLKGGVALLAGVVSIYFADEHPALVTASFAVALVVYFAGLAVMFFKDSF